MKTKLMVGFVGYSDDSKFDYDEGQKQVVKAFDDLVSIYLNYEIVAVSGLTDVGIPALVYREATKRGMKTVGVACRMAFDYATFATDETFIEGEEWGDESNTFLSMINVMVKIGGGAQSIDERDMAIDLGMTVYEYDV